MLKKSFLTLVIICILAGALSADFEEGGKFWFTLKKAASLEPLTCLDVSGLDQFTLDAWLSIDRPECGYVGGFTFSIVYDTNYLEIDTMYIDETVWGNYMFHGLRWPGDAFGLFPGRAMWFAILCLADCLPSFGVYHIGVVRFNVINTPPRECVTVIDTGMYPPGGRPVIAACNPYYGLVPQWEVFKIRSSSQSGVDSRELKSRPYLVISGPNPTSRDIGVNYSVGLGIPFRISVYNSTGSLVGIPVKGYGDASAHSLRLDLRSLNGEFLPAGIYFIKLDAGDRSVVKRVVFTR